MRAMDSNFFKNQTIYIYKEKLKDMDKKEFTKEERIIYRILIWLFCILCLCTSFAGYRMADATLDKIAEYTITSII